MPTGRRPLGRAALDLRPSVLFFGVSAITALAFLPSLSCGFVNFDDVILLGTVDYRGLGWSNIRWMFSALRASCNYMPMSWLTFGADFTIWGMEPSGYHLTSLIFHCANAALFSLVALEFLAAAKPSDLDRWAAAAAALLFALHPLRVESVVWIFERQDVVCGFFFLLTMLFWMRACRAGEARPGRWRAFALAGFFLCLMSKLSGVMLPAALVLLDVYPLRRLPASPRKWTSPPLRPIWREKIPFFALAAVFTFVGIKAQEQCGAALSMEKYGIVGRGLTAATGLLFYVGKTLWPTALSLIYRWRAEALEVPVLIGAAALSLGAVAACVSRRLRPILLTAFGWYALMLVPVLGLFKFGGQIASDRYSYLPCMAWALLAGAGFRIALRKAPGIAAFTAAAVFLILGRATWVQADVWRDSATLWRHCLKFDPRSSIAHENLAAALIDQKRVGEAILYLEEEIHLYPQDVSSKKRLDQLIAATHTTFRDHARFHDELGIERAELGQLQQASWHFHKALLYDPHSKKIKANIEKIDRGETTGFER